MVMTSQCWFACMDVQYICRGTSTACHAVGKLTETVCLLLPSAYASSTQSLCFVVLACGRQHLDCTFVVVQTGAAQADRHV